MDASNGKNWTTEDGKKCNIGNLENRSECLGGTALTSKEYGTYTLAVSGKDCDTGDTLVARERSGDGIAGEVVIRLILEIKKQLLYHQEQSEVLQRQLADLEQVLKACSHVENTD